MRGTPGSSPGPRIAVVRRVEPPPSPVMNSQPPPRSPTATADPAWGPGEMLVADYPVLEDRFVAEIRRLKQEDPLATVRVLVPTQLLRQHLSRLLVQELGGHLGVGFTTIPTLTIDLAAASEVSEDLRPLPGLDPHLSAELLLGKIAEESADGPDFYFATLAPKPGFHRALLRTITDLKEALITRATFEQAIQDSANDPETGGKLMSLLALWTAYEERLTQLKCVDPADEALFAIGRLAVRGFAAGDSRAVVYGFYDLNEQQRRLVAAFCQNTPSLVLFPTDCSPAFRWTEATRQWLESQGFRPVHYGHAGSKRRPPFFRGLVQRLFAPPSGPSLETGNRVRIVAAPGVAPEVRELAREILLAVDHDDTLRFSDICLVPRALPPYRAVVQEVFSRAGIPINLLTPPPLAETAPGKAALLLLELVEQDFPRARVMELATGFPLQQERDSPPVLWDQLTVEAGIVGGVQEWQDRLPTLGNESDTDNEGAEEDDSLTEKQRAAEALRWYVEQLLTFGLRFRGVRSFETAAAALCDCLRHLLTASPQLEEVLQVVESLGQLDLLGEPADPATVRRSLETLLTRRPQTTVAPAPHGVVVADIMAARGTPFRMVLIPGLVEKSFPAPARQDPLLLDAERLRLNNALTGLGTGGELPERRRRVEEERLLFRLACGMATERLVLSYPRLDPVSGRELVPSHFLLRIVEAVTGRRATYQDLERFPGFVRVPLSRLAAADPGFALDELEFDLGRVASALQANRPETTLYLSHLYPCFRRGVRAEQNRWGRHEFTAWDGSLSSPACQDHLSRFALDRQPVSPTALETFGTCPYRYLLAHVFRLTVWEEPDRAPTIAPKDRGTLIHRILRTFHEQLLRQERWPPEEEEEAQLLQVAEREFQRFAATGATGFPLLWELEKRTIRRNLRHLIRLEQEGAVDWQPWELEREYGHPDDPNPPGLTLDNGETISFRGRVDRLDVDAAGRRARVLDYKTGRKPSSLKCDSFDGGVALQLPLYLVAMEHHLRNTGTGLHLDHALFWYITRKANFATVTFRTEEWEEKISTLRRILTTFAACIRSGRFFPNPDEQGKCRMCDFALVCGAGKEVRFQRKQGDGRAADYLALRDIE